VSAKKPAKLKIISGGQTGADRAALDWAIAHQFPYGGWCPKGRLAEDGVIDPKYKLKETPSASYAQRTECNIRDSDGTVLFSTTEQISGGARLTANLARLAKKPFLHLTLAKNSTDAAARLKAFISRYKIQVLNVSGPRASEEPHIGQFVQQVLSQALDASTEPADAAASKPAPASKPVARPRPAPARARA
jgi:hypothetical protein